MGLQEGDKQKLIFMLRYSVILLIVLSFSCKTKKQVSKVSIETKTETVIVEKKDSVSVQQNAISIKESIDEIEVVPIDQSKPIVVGGKEYFNATVRFKKINLEIVDTTKIAVAQIVDKKIEVKQEESKKEFTKEVERKFNYYSLLWLLLIPLLLWVFKRFVLK